MKDNHPSDREQRHRAWQPAIGLALVLAAVLVLVARPSKAGSEASNTGYKPLVLAQPSLAASPLFGIDFISSAEDRAPGSKRTPPSLEQQYQNGLSTGATWNRWPLYWFNIEQSPGAFNWATQDATVRADLAHGLRINAILLGTPGFYTTDATARVSRPPRSRAGQLSLDASERATPVGLYEPIFNDGTDKPGAGKAINPANKWANFVWLAVSRYKPGGVLAQSEGWPAGAGVTHWEMWNESDFEIFWNASREDYARLLKVGYLSAKQADPSAQVLFAGLANSEKPDFYRDVLVILKNDPMAVQYGYYHDILATHSYFHAWKSWYHVYRALGTMREFGFEKPIWLNESGVPAWNDYPGPVWDSKSALRATMDEGAAYALQSAMYALFAGADAVYHFQLYDGCGNQPAGTDFPPHNGELCDENGLYQGKPCAGDANGLYRNPTDASCFTQHPQPASPRPTRSAYRVLTQYLQGIEPYWRKREGAVQACPMESPGQGLIYAPPQEWIAFYRRATQERIVGLWTLCGRTETAVVDATSPDGRAVLVYPDGRTQSIAAVDGHYSISLPPGTNRNPYPFGGYPNAVYPIGGMPVILIERDLTAADLPFKNFAPIVGSATGR